MPLGKSGIGFFNQGDLVGTQRNRLLHRPLLELEQSLVATAQALLVQDALDGWCRNLDAIERKKIADAIAAPSGMFERQADDPLDYLGRGGLGMGLGNRR